MAVDRRSFQFVYAVIILLQMEAVLGFNPTAQDVNVRCIERERQALLKFKQGVEDRYGRLSSWGSEEGKKECCKWTGVRCNNITGHITVLDLNSESKAYQRLRGRLSASLFELQHLTYLDLSLNDFNFSRIPKSIGSLNKLKHLAVPSCALGGSLPTQLGNLTSLQFLDLGINFFESANNLEWLSNLSSLQQLRLTGLDLSKVVDWLTVVNKLPHLEELELRGCRLVDVPQQSLSLINASTSLAVLDLGYNNLTASTFQWVFNFSSSLVYLDLSLNQLKGLIPEAFGNMTSLEQLRLQNNELDGGIPKSIGKMCNLRYIYLIENNLKGMLSEFILNLTVGCLRFSLESLALENNQIIGKLPTDLSRLSLLRELWLSNNRLNGTLPESIGLLSKLEALDISLNSISGEVSEAHFSNLSSLRHLDLSFNPLSMNFGHDLFPPFQLDYISLRSCKLGPHFPKWLQTQRNFSFLDISNNTISDRIPKWFWDLSPRIVYLDLSFNQIYGTLPDLSTKFSGSPGIDLSFNDLEGPLPAFPPNVSSINLSRNKFSGSISPLCTVTDFSVNFIDLSNNQLSGELPDCIMRWGRLKILNLASNHLSGKIPNSYGSLCYLETINLRSNHFSGELPSSLENCSWLKFLDLSYNSLSGEIPVWLGERLQFLSFVILKSNNLNGGIPLQLCQLTYMQLLDLSVNNLSGSIPHCVNNLTALVTNEIFYSGYHYTASIIDEISSYGGSYTDEASFTWKGIVYSYPNLTLLRAIDLSCNMLTGEIPTQIWSLLELHHLNLSRNQLTGSISQDIEQMKELESFDLSRNRLSGPIPESMARLNFLNHLNLSYNNFSGRIPTGTQLQTFNATSFMGNLALCGPPLTATCPDEDEDSERHLLRDDDEEDADEFWKWFCSGAGLGVAIGFAGVVTLQFNQSWKHGCFRLFNELKDCIYVAVAAFPLVIKVLAARLWRKWRNFKM